MYTDEQLQAWTRLKRHLTETCILLRSAAEGNEDIKEPTEAIINDIDSNIDIVETLFLI